MKKLLISLFCFGILATLIQFRQVYAATDVTGYNHLNNGYIQFTDFGGTESGIDWTDLSKSVVGNAVNEYGNLNNPYYFDGTAWRPLTLYRKMEYALSEGGTLVSIADPYQVSGAGPIVYPATNNQALTNYSIDGTGITKTDLETTAGSSTYTGTLVSKGEVIVNGKNLEIKNTYTLLEGKSFVRVKTKITNLETSLTATNIRYWVGTGDDWISLDDSNYKTRGNIVDGAFAQVSTSAQQAKAIRVDSRSLTESILFYSTHPNANTSVAYCCSFSNAVDTNPINSAINVLNDGSYTLFVNLGSIAPGTSVEFDWYYAAGSAATILDTINEVALDSSGASDITGNSATITYSSQTVTTGYYMVVPRGSTAPNVNQIIGEEEYVNVPVIKRGNLLMEAGVETPIEITDLSPNSHYDVYFVTRNSEGSTSSISKTTFSTVAYSVISLKHFDSIDIPKNHKIPDSSEIETVEYSATVEWLPNTERFVVGQMYTATITVTPKAGYTLIGVGANSFTVFGASTVVNDANSGIITATYPEVLFDKVNFHSNGGTIVNSVDIDFGDLINKPIDPILTNYDFMGWFKDNGTFQDAWDFSKDTMTEGDMNLYAKWTPTVYQINYVLDGGVNFVDALTSYTVESLIISLNEPTKNGYTFQGWYQNADKETGGVITLIPQGSNGDKTFFAKWTPTIYQINYVLDGGVNFAEAEYTYTIESSDISLNIPTKNGYTFEGWYENVDKQTGGITTVIPQGSTGVKTYYAKWSPTIYQINYELDGGTNFEGALTTYTIESSDINLSQPNKNGYTFDGWYENPDKETGDPVVSIPQGSYGNKKLYAKWTPIPVSYVGDEILEFIIRNVAEGISFTAEELKKKVSIQVVITVLELADLDENEKSVLNQYIAQHLSNGAKNSFFLDISLFKWVDQNQIKITSTTSMTSITFIVPEIFRNQEFMLVRIHDGVVERLQYTYNPNTFELNFATDRFSSYGLLSWSANLPETKDNANGLKFLLLGVGVFLLLASKKKRQVK